jgi:hypothetical protein
MIKDLYGRRRFEIRFEKWYENDGQRGKPCPVRPWKTMSSQAGVHVLFLFEKGHLLVAIFSPGNFKSRPGQLPDLFVSGLSTGFKNYHKQYIYF